MEEWDIGRGVYNVDLDDGVYINAFVMRIELKFDT